MPRKLLNSPWILQQLWVYLERNWELFIGRIEVWDVLDRAEPTATTSEAVDCGTE
jgi:hypothetical protein